MCAAWAGLPRFREHHAGARAAPCHGGRPGAAQRRQHPRSLPGQQPRRQRGVRFWLCPSWTAQQRPRAPGKVLARGSPHAFCLTTWPACTRCCCCQACPTLPVIALDQTAAGALGTLVCSRLRAAPGGLDMMPDGCLQASGGATSVPAADAAEHADPAGSGCAAEDVEHAGGQPAASPFSQSAQLDFRDSKAGSSSTASTAKSMAGRPSDAGVDSLTHNLSSSALALGRGASEALHRLWQARCPPCCESWAQCRPAAGLTRHMRNRGDIVCPGSLTPQLCRCPSPAGRPPLSASSPQTAGRPP